MGCDRSVRIAGTQLKTVSATSNVVPQQLARLDLAGCFVFAKGLAVLHFFLSAGALRCTLSVGVIVSLSIASRCISAQTAVADITESAPQEAMALEAKLISRTRQLTFDGRRAGESYFSADGRRMIFQSEREPGNPFFQIYLMDLDTGDTQRAGGP